MCKKNPCLATLVVLAVATAPPAPAQVREARDARVEDVLAQMSLEEKVGEMTQLTLQAVSKTMGTARVEHELDQAKLEEALLRYHVGSLLNVWDVAFTPQHWESIIRTVQQTAQKKRLRIPVLYGIDAVHGHHYMRGATIFPHNLALAATWNPELVRQANEITAIETRASGIAWNFSPVLDLARQPLWSRFFETFGEDVHLAETMGAAAVEGQQGPRARPSLRVAATGKHYLGYSMPRTGKDRTPAWIPDRMLFEYFVPPFRSAIEAGLRTVMVNSGDINGVPVHASRELLTDLLRNQLGFTGVAVTDWEDIIKLHTVHHVAASPKDAVRIAVMAGIDMSMVPYDLSFATHLTELVREGAIPESRLDESVRRILKLKFDLGLFDNPYADPAKLHTVGAPASQQVSRTAAEEALTLLKNEGVLPLAKTARVLVTGPGADALPPLHGSWTYTWQGTDTAMYPKTTKTVLAAVQAEIGAQQVIYAPGTDMRDEIGIAAAVNAARDVDVVIVCLAEKPSTEKVGDIDDLTLPEAQQRLARAIIATGKPVVIVLIENRPQIVRMVVDSARAVLLAYQPGPHGGDAIADVLFGDVNPSGKLPFTYPRFPNALLTYDHTYAEMVGPESSEGGFNPQWEFGHGLSYTTFAHSDLRLDKTTVDADGKLNVTVAVRNTGNRAGKEVVQLYVRDLYASVAPPVKRLRAFKKISLDSGQAETVTFTLTISDLAFVGLDNRPVVEPGEFEIMIGGKTQRFTVTVP